MQSGHAPGRPGGRRYSQPDRLAAGETGCRGAAGDYSRRSMINHERLARVGPGLLAVLLAAAYLGWVVVPGLRQDGPQPARDEGGAPVTFESHLLPMFEQHCNSCHGERKRAGLDLRGYTSADSVTADRATFAAILQNLEGRLMPPENKPQPTPEARDLAVAWLKSELFRVDCNHPDPGRVTLRRLNRTEYNNTIRDLVGVDFQPAAGFPMDDVGYGFDNIGDVLSLPPVLLEKYLAAAREILDRAIVAGPPPVPSRRHAGPALTGGSDGGGGGRTLASQGVIGAQHPFAAPGEYVIRVQASGDQAGSEAVRLEVRLDGRILREFEVTARPGSPQVCEVPVVLQDARARRIEAAFLNDFYAPDHPDPSRRDRNLHVHWIEVAGPTPAGPPALSASHRRIIFTSPAADTPEAMTAAARAVIGEFTRRAFRRPVEPAELDRLVALFGAARADGDGFEGALKVALQAVLISPHFLFRGELQPEPDNPASVHPVNEYALASRLSYFLWSTMPDEELFRLAAEGRLRRQLTAQVRRMLRDPRARALVDDFAAQWLQFRNLEVADPDRGTFPDFDDALRAAMRREAELFAGRILREDRSVLEFLDADWTYLNGRLARHYGLGGVEGDDFRLVSLRGTRRGGVLTQGSFLTITSNPTRTSPVKRGKWVLENLLNRPPPDAPPDVPLLDESKEAQLTGTLRQRFEQHRADPLCSACHALMDPIGFGFENFDGVGAYRETDGGFPIDASGELVSGETFNGPADLKRILLTVKRDEFLRCVAAKLLTYALGRGLQEYDRCAVDGILAALEAGEHRFSALVQGVVMSVPFQMRRGEAGPGSPEVGNLTGGTDGASLVSSGEPLATQPLAAGTGALARP